MSLRERKKQRTRQAISDAAIALFLDAGFDRVSVAEVAAAAEVSKPTLFKYFPAKEDLVIDRLADHREEAAAVVRAATGRPPLAALHEHFRTGLDRRDPITGLCDEPEVLALNRLIYDTPALLAGMSRFTDHSVDALTTALREATGRDDLAPRLAAGQIVTVQRLLALENHRHITAGETAAARHPAAAAEADQAFGLLRSGLDGL
ncbi:TetR/AcrR family transcriptional regulator [Amycolatopsis sp. 195334CR]|uniref:TetR/AcrR family transcriptional regulator n=1 Tax=Amycolatopsis sp. 195334CR TaxID=2814588 RepID=UPI001A8F05A5|nr:TetR/AcrR family transcriptional regulator [Amycolatopsis sp. 195334CR]MBN6039939.1 TetR/AcrR family transcriptional regulator [Amycolatopsis sp. 195334CR]